MGIENERPATALSIESIPKSVSEVQVMEATTEAPAADSLEPPEERKQRKISEKNGNLDMRFDTRTL